MSELNGDKARFQRLRKASVHRRARSRVTLAELRLSARLPPGGESEAGGGPGQGSETRPASGGLAAD